MTSTKGHSINMGNDKCIIVQDAILYQPFPLFQLDGMADGNSVSGCTDGLGGAPQHSVESRPHAELQEPPAFVHSVGPCQS